MDLKIKNIILADDDYDDKDLLEEAIKKNCPDVLFKHADNSTTLFDLLKSSPAPDIIILDINMPYLNGNECLQIIKGNNALKGIKVIMYSTSSNKTDIEESFLHGADHYVIKPDNIEALHKLAKDICNGTIKSGERY